MMLFTFFVFNRKYSFWANFIQKIKIVSLRWSLVTSLIRICRIQRCCSLFSFSIRNTLFQQISQKIKIISLRWNLVLRLIRICRIQRCCSLFSVFNRKYPLCTTLVEKIKILRFRWKLIPRVIRICRIQWWYSLFLIRPEILFWRKFDPKNEICQFKLKFGAQNNSNLQNSLSMFTFSFWYQKYLFWLNFFQNVKIVSLSKDLRATTCQKI